MEKNNLNTLSLIWLLIIFAWLLDILTSFVGVSMGIREGSALFGLFPAMWMALFLGLSTFVYFFRWAPENLRKIILLGIVLGSFVPMLRNLFVLMHVLNISGIYQMVIS